MYLNQCNIVGRLGKDPEIRGFGNGGTVASFTVATTRVWKNGQGQKQEETEWHNITAFGKLADIIGQYAKKGQLVLVTGRLKTDSWEKDGQKYYKTGIIAETFVMGPKGSDNSGNTGYNQNSRSQYQNKNQKVDNYFNNFNEVETIEYPDDDINPDDIPF